MMVFFLPSFLTLPPVILSKNPPLPPICFFSFCAGTVPTTSITLPGFVAIFSAFNPSFGPCASGFGADGFNGYSPNFSLNHSFRSAIACASPKTELVKKYSVSAAGQLFTNMNENSGRMRTIPCFILLVCIDAPASPPRYICSPMDMDDTSGRM